MTNQRKATAMTDYSPTRFDSIRVMGVILILAALGMGYLMGDAFARGETSTIGGDEVPYNLDCEEDEVIGYNPDLPTPRDLTCVSYEIFENRGAEQASS